MRAHPPSSPRAPTVLERCPGGYVHEAPVEGEVVRRVGEGDEKTLERLSRIPRRRRGREGRRALRPLPLGGGSGRG